jgi:hypothetical protein
MYLQATAIERFQRLKELLPLSEGDRQHRRENATSEVAPATKRN